MEVTQETTTILALIGLLMIGGCLVSILGLVLFHIKYPADPDDLTQRMEQQAWSAGQVGIMACVLMLGMVLMALIGALLPGDANGPAPLLLALSFATTQLIALILLGRQRRTTWREDFSMTGQKLKAVGLAPLIYLSAVPVIGIATTIYHALLRRFGIEPGLQNVVELIAASSAWVKVGYVFLAVVAAPFYEELIFRGTFLPFMVRRFGLVPGITMVSLIFAAIHFHLPTMVPLFLFSVVLCLAYWRTRTLWTSIALHAVFNAVTVLLAPLYVQ
ncbi:MAG: CPBP family intramembrane metalloprotease [Pontiellaceae bacterium]|nr:CPBP family intramembrane metalloprotease [Pontiellaceae bacterium]MBN2785421.1 CPBP family intramembrane metalloprotease [Pontiellaceae bacterium]